MRGKKITASIGSISHGTMRPEDLIPDFAYELKRLDTKHQYSNLIREAKNVDWDNTDYVNNDVPYLMENLFDALDNFAPPYCYFGAHQGDGSDYGFWPSEFIENDFDGIKVADTADVPKGFKGDVLYVNDHGNMTLYYSNGRTLKEIWSIV